MNSKVDKQELPAAVLTTVGAVGPVPAPFAL